MIPSTTKARRGHLSICTLHYKSNSTVVHSLDASATKSGTDY